MQDGEWFGNKNPSLFKRLGCSRLKPFPSQSGFLPIPAVVLGSLRNAVKNNFYLHNRRDLQLGLTFSLE